MFGRLVIIVFIILAVDAGFAVVQDKRITAKQGETVNLVCRTKETSVEWLYSDGRPVDGSNPCISFSYVDCMQAYKKTGTCADDSLIDHVLTIRAINVSDQGQIICREGKGFGPESATYVQVDGVDECVNGSLNNCVRNSVCNNTPGGYECICRPGYVGVGNISCTPELTAQGHASHSSATLWLNLLTFVVVVYSMF